MYLAKRSARIQSTHQKHYRSLPPLLPLVAIFALKTLCFPRRALWYTGQRLAKYWRSKHDPIEPPSALQQSTQLSDSLSKAPVSCQSCLRWTNTATHTAVQPPSHVSNASALWRIMRKIKHITSITLLTHFSGAHVSRCAEAFSQDFCDPRRHPETQLSFKFRLT